MNFKEIRENYNLENIPNPFRGVLPQVQKILKDINNPYIRISTDLISFLKSTDEEFLKSKTCPICGNISYFDQKCHRWFKACNNPECKKALRSKSGRERGISNWKDDSTTHQIKLTPKMKKIIPLYLKGYTSYEVKRELKITDSSIHSTMNKLRRQLFCKTNFELFAKLIHYKIFTIENDPRIENAILNKKEKIDSILYPVYLDTAKLVALGYTDKEIAQKLNCNERAISSRKSYIRNKLNARRIYQAIYFLIYNNFINPGIEKPLPNITEKRFLFLTAYANGFLPEEIAYHLEISKISVYTTFKRMMDQSGCKNYYELISLLAQYKICPILTEKEIIMKLQQHITG